MSTQYDSLPEFGDKYLQIFDPIAKSFHLRRRSRAEGNVNISEAMELIAALLRRYQMSFLPNKEDGTLVMFPYMFTQPVVGDQIRNITTSEVYTIKEVIINPDTKNWDGVVRITAVTPPSIEKRSKLEYLNFDRYVRFDHELPNGLPNQLSANSEAVQINLLPMPPTITWSLKQVEPGSHDRPFGTTKQYKPVLRESTKDPYVKGYTVEVWGQTFDNLVQFSSWSGDNRTSERLIRWFEQFLKLYTGALRKNGVAQMFFWQRTQDQMNTTWRQFYSIKDTQWYFRTEELQAVYQRDILKIDLSIGVEETLPSIYLNETKYIADQKVSGNFNSQEYKNLFYRSGEYLFGDVEIRQ